jgi:L-threonylcarbamoyladenylate synthase
MVDFLDDIESCLQVLRNGGLILYPTDTIWGIGCDSTNEEAVERVYRLKQRNDEKAMIVLVTEERDVLKHVAAPDMSVFDLLKKANKPTTVIYDGALGFADNLIGRDGSIAIRICEDTFCRHLVKRFGEPIVSTSANISGQTSPVNFNDISEEIKSGVDYIVKYRQTETSKSIPSSLIKFKNGKIEILRP